MHTDSTKKGRILLGESIRQTASKMKAALESDGYEVEQAADGEQCLEKARTSRPELVVLDILLPKIHGIEVLKELRADPGTAGTGVIVCTAKDFKTDHIEAAVLGVHEYLIKPVAPATLLEKVNAFFESRGSGTAIAPESAEQATAAPAPYISEFDAWGNRFALWGTRGSTPTPGSRFQRHGGNTSCFCVTYGEEKFVFDAGSGIRELGAEIMRGKRRKIHLFITHTHWDHIQGFPFFLPAYVPGFEITIWGAELFGKDLKSVFSGQLDRDYFPVQMEDMNSNLDFRHLPDGPITIGDATVSWEYSQHPGATVGYKIDVGGLRIAWVPDNEFLQAYTGDPRRISRQDPLVIPYRKMIQFLSDADMVVHEGQYTCEEYATKIGWGHSSVANACMLMKFAGVRRWIITHHDPGHDDDFLELKLAHTRRILRDIGHECHVINGYDGMTEYL
jgi:phosphoribosyl 1,2-cyclic phosphodiesterase/ActR/RegA family two-component response regulator